MARLQTRFPVLVLSLIVALAVAELAMAQPPQRGGRGRGGGGLGMGQITPIRLLTLEQVRSELNLNEEQAAKVAEINQEAQAKRTEIIQSATPGGGFGEIQQQLQELDSQTREQVTAVLDDSQQKRLRGIWVQVVGVAALLNEEVASELGITDAQREQLQEAGAGRGGFGRGRGGRGFQDLTPEEQAERLATLRREREERALAVLTADQRQKYEEMKGEAVDIDTSQLAPLGRGRGGFGGRGEGRGGRRGGAN